ncbi:MAG: hypothetical protein WB760_14235 [Xanthobacteraceae bacterium]
MGYKRLRSRKDLITVATWVATPEDAKQAADRAALSDPKYWRNPIDEAGKAIRKQIASLREFSTAAIRREGKDPSQYQDIIEGSKFADRAYCAALILKTLDDVEKSLNNVEEGWGDFTFMGQSALEALFFALECAHHLQMFTLADHEREIVTGTRTATNMRESSSRANAARSKRRNREWARWNAESARIWERHPSWSRQAVARQVKLKLELDERERTIAKQLKKLGTAG